VTTVLLRFKGKTSGNMLIGFVGQSLGISAVDLTEDGSGGWW
jgi:hypothetical protein